ncbi:MAG: HmuY family protein [Ferruginibacter sp.]
MLNTQKLQALVIISMFLFASCKKDQDPIIIVPPSTGSTLVLNGLTGTEMSGATAGNTVYLDLSSNTTTNVTRANWDLAFYCGNEFRVALNNTSGAGAKVLSINDLSAVNAADTIGLTLAVNHAAPVPADFAYFDHIDGAITGTVIPETSATGANNNVVIINRGAGGGIAERPWIKLRVLRNGANGYTIQYAGILSSTYQTVHIAKDEAYHYLLFSFDNGVLNNGQPRKNAWDLAWTYSLYQTNFGGGMVPYNFSDLIETNHLSNVQVKEKIYADANAATAAYTAFNKDSVNALANATATGKWVIAGKWRSTQPATGAKLDRFYLIKDANGNNYKLRCLSMGVGADGGTRGKPKFQYELITM